jgi:fumarylacetoacetase
MAKPFRTKGPKQEPTHFPIFTKKGKHSFDINLEVAIQPENVQRLFLIL